MAMIHCGVCDRLRNPGDCEHTQWLARKPAKEKEGKNGTSRRKDGR
jgi:hypothetical protein